jgi:aryl-alcohol dehydrogenase-like predicted oxidoreductase
MQSPCTVARSVLGSSAVTVPRIGIGAGTLSNSDGPAALIGALEAGLRRGLNYVDTAPPYLDGGSERAIGEFVSGHRREDIVLATPHPRRRHRDRTPSPHDHPERRPGVAVGAPLPARRGRRHL